MNFDQGKRECQIPDIASLRLDSDAARYHWIEHLEISKALSEEARILRHDPRLCAPSRTYGQDLDPSALLIIAIYGYLRFSEKRLFVDKGRTRSEQDTKYTSL